MIKEETITKLDSKTLSAMERYHRAVNYLAVAQIYLKENSLLEKPLQPEHIKERLLGHWGTSPGINFIYLHLNRLILETQAGILLVTGPGHGAAANLANMYLEGALTEFFPELTRDRAGLEKFVRRFSWPDGFPSHLNPGLPGVINEGGELGYALSTSFGAALDNPDLIVACIVGDGEAETGPMATAWHGNKFLNPSTDGAVLPILHLNRYKISSPTIFGTMSRDELERLFTGYGYAVRFVENSDRIHEDFYQTLSWAFGKIREIDQQARSGWSASAKATAEYPAVASEGREGGRPQWPMIILATPKGWTGPKEVDGKKMEGTFRAHQVPAKEAKTNPTHLRILEQWLRSYRPEELFDKNGRPSEDILKLCPQGNYRMAMNPHGFGGKMRKPLLLPDLKSHAIAVKIRGDVKISGMEKLGKYLAEVIEKNAGERNFRIVCPDELESNRLGAVLNVTARQYVWPIPSEAEHIAADGRVMEMLSEHNCQGWLQGYLLTGRHGLFPCYEAFVSIVDSMMNQYAKFLKSSHEVSWRAPVSSLNYILTSEAWRQDHNGYSHQGPGFINNVLTKKGYTYRVYLPPDFNCLLSTIDHCLRSTNYINLIIAGKQPMPQWLSMEEACEHCRVGASVWKWAGNDKDQRPDIVLAGCSDNLTLEVLAAAQILRDETPEWKVRVVNVTDLQVLGIPQKYPHGLSEDKFQQLFPLNVPVVFNFHGYTAAIKQLCWERPQNERFDLNGYREEGTTTTPFDMQVRNRTSRYHLVIQSAQKIGARNSNAAHKVNQLVSKYEGKLKEHHRYITTYGIDPPEVSDWQWQES